MDSLPRSVRDVSPAPLIALLIDAEGSTAHPYSRSAAAGDRQSFVRDLVDFADFVHLCSLLHGHTPSIIDLAARHTVEPVARTWLIAAMDAFSTERTYLSQIAVAAGPLPSTARHGETTAVISQQRHALEMLAQSDRRGCALGAAVAFVIEWQAMRTILDAGAARLGIEPPTCAMPNREATLTVLEALAEPDKLARAMQFGAAQLVGQHRGLWDLLQARVMVRQEQY